MPTGARIPLAVKLAAVQLANQPQANREQIARDHGVAVTTIERWMKLAKMGRSLDKRAQPTAAAPAEVKRRRCTKCGKTKPLTEFNKHPTAKDGRNPSCRVCQAKYHAAHRAAKRMSQGQAAVSVKAPPAVATHSGLHGALVYLKRARDLGTKSDYASEAFLSCMLALARLEREVQE
jgi:transposase-like protein